MILSKVINKTLTPVWWLAERQARHGDAPDTHRESSIFTGRVCGAVGIAIGGVMVQVGAPWWLVGLLTIVLLLDALFSVLVNMYRRGEIE